MSRIDSLAREAFDRVHELIGALIRDAGVMAFGDDQDILATHDGTDSLRVTNADAGVVAIDDDVAIFVDPAAPTKRMRLDAGAVTAAQTRVLSMADRDVDLDFALQRVFVTIPAADVATLNATPYAVIAAPGAGKYIEVVTAHWWLDFGTVGYDAAAAGDALTLKYTNAAGAAVVDAVAGDVIGAAVADYHTEVKAVPEVVPVANAAIVASIAVGEWYAAAGNSPLKVEALYRVRTLAPAA